jgi:small conductance mechanosensitive channel
MDVSVASLQTLVTTYALRVVGVVIFLALAWILAGFLRGLITKRMIKRSFDPGLAKFLGSLVRISILVMAIISSLGVFGIETTSFAAVLAGAGLAIGMALQGSLSNFAAGVLLLTFRPFKTDDVITVAGQTGKVMEIELFTTALDTPDNRRIIVPNGAILSSVIENITFHPKRRVDVVVGTDYSADLKKTREVLTKAALTVEGRLADEDPIIVLTGLGASSIDWQVRIWAKTEDFWAVKEASTEAVKEALDAEGIGIPFPQMDVHLDK